MRVALLVALTGCGRLGFTALDDTDAALDSPVALISC